jgi:hypothetical protein
MICINGKGYSTYHRQSEKLSGKSVFGENNVRFYNDAMCRMLWGKGMNSIMAQHGTAHYIEIA